MVTQEIFQLFGKFFPTLYLHRLEEETRSLEMFKHHLKEGENVIKQCVLNELLEDVESKLLEMKEEFQSVINEKDDELTIKLDEILTNTNHVEIDCSSHERSKIENLQKELDRNWSLLDPPNEVLLPLAQRLDELLAIDEAANTNLTDMLNGILDKLDKQEEQITKLEAVIPDMEKASKYMDRIKAKTKSDCNAKKCISKKILEFSKAEEGIAGN